MLAVELGGKFAVLKSAEGAEITEQNPLGQVPYMKEGDTTLAESAAILRYLGREYAPKKYVPRAAQLCLADRNAMLLIGFC